MHPAGASRPEEELRVCRKERGKEKGWATRALQFLGNRRPISARAKSTLPGVFRRQRSAASIHRGRSLPPSSSHSTAETDVARNRAILHSPLPPSPIPHFWCRIFLHACGILCSLFLSRRCRHARVLSTNNTPERARWRAMEGAVYTRNRRKTAGDDCGLQPRKTIAVG